MRGRPFADTGLGRRIAKALLAGVSADRLVTVNAAPASFSFWESLGFVPDARDGHTHIRPVRPYPNNVQATLRVFGPCDGRRC
jgi:hypothetical protein